MRNFFALTPFNPGDTRINTAPVQNALESWGQTTRQNELLKRQSEEQAYQRGRDQKQDARADETYKMQGLERLGKSAFAYSQLPPEQRDPAMWGRMVKGMQSYDPTIGTDPDDLDPIAGPAKFAAVYGGMVRDPREDKLMDLKVQAAERDLTKPMGGEDPNAVREYRYYMSLPPDQKAEYLRVKRAEKALDLGPRYVIPDVANPAGAPAATFEKDLADAEAQKKLGAAIGEAAAGAEGDLSAAETALELVESIRRDPDREAGTAVYSPLGNLIPKTPGYSFEKKVEQAKSGAFLTAIQQLRGMGALSNAEGQTATAAVTRMTTATDDDAFEEALQDYEKLVLRGQRKAQKMLKERERLLSGGRSGSPAPDGAPDFKLKYGLE